MWRRGIVWVGLTAHLVTGWGCKEDPHESPAPLDDSGADAAGGSGATGGADAGGDGGADAGGDGGADAGGDGGADAGGGAGAGGSGGTDAGGSGGTDAGGGGAGGLENPFIPDTDTDLYVSEAGDDISGDGSRDAPFATIGRAFVAAEELEAAGSATAVLVHIAAGEYTQPVVITDPVVHLRGGYSEDFATRTPRSTLLFGTNQPSASFPASVSCHSGASVPVLVEGFTLHARQNSGGAAYAVGATGGCRLTVRDSLVEYGPTDDAISGYGAHAEAGAELVLEDNDIVGALGVMGRHAGVFLEPDAGAARIRRNRIVAGSGPGAATADGAAIYALADDALVENNLILGSELDFGWGIVIGGSGARVFNNTIVAEGGGFAAGITMRQSSSEARIENNLVALIGDPPLIGRQVRGALVREGSGSLPASVVNNALFGAVLYVDAEVLPSNCADDGAHCFVSVTELNASSVAGTVSGNLGGSLDDFDGVLVDIDGSDGSMLTLFDNDWTPSPGAMNCSIHQGGVDLSDEVGVLAFGLTTRTAVVDCGPTNSGAAGWSIGAIEVE